MIEADEGTKMIYLEAINEINRKMNIPEIWQQGEICRLYKGKGIKGKCSNERGITLSSNFGKLYERMINERIMPMINITRPINIIILINITYLKNIIALINITTQKI